MKENIKIYELNKALSQTISIMANYQDVVKNQLFEGVTPYLTLSNSLSLVMKQIADTVNSYSNFQNSFQGINQQLIELIKPNYSFQLSILKIVEAFRDNLKDTINTNNLKLNEMSMELLKVTSSAKLNPCLDDTLSQFKQTISEMNKSIVSHDSLKSNIVSAFEKYKYSVDIGLVENAQTLDGCEDELLECLEDSINKDSFEDTINKLFLEASGKHPVIAYFITSFVIPILLTFSTSFLQQSTVINYNTYIEKTDIILNVKDEIKHVNDNFFAIGSSDIVNYNYICKDNTFMYSSKSTRSPVLYRLKEGAIIEVIDRIGKWTLVKYSFEDISVEGYILNKYLRRFKVVRKNIS